MPPPRQKSVKQLFLLSPDNLHPQMAQRGGGEDSFVQVGLTDRFNMECTFDQEATPHSPHHPTEKECGGLESKIAQYRRALGLPAHE